MASPTTSVPRSVFGASAHGPQTPLLPVTETPHNSDRGAAADPHPLWRDVVVKRTKAVGQAFFAAIGAAIVGGAAGHGLGAFVAQNEVGLRRLSGNAADQVLGARPTLFFCAGAATAGAIGLSMVCKSSAFTKRLAALPMGVLGALVIGFPAAYILADIGSGICHRGALALGAHADSMATLGWEVGAGVGVGLGSYVGGGAGSYAPWA